MLRKIMPKNNKCIKIMFQNTPFGVTSDKDDADISTNDILYVDRPELLARFAKGDIIKFW